MFFNDNCEREAHANDGPATLSLTQKKLGENLRTAQYDVLKELVSAYEKNAKENLYVVILGYKDKDYR
ncbi:hypothetical protein K3495_g6478 [Podosphaera aphanis]|nr:hypothetical protein K3495_g6478 [Podosphaera aphanis]